MKRNPLDFEIDRKCQNVQSPSICLWPPAIWSRDLFYFSYIRGDFYTVTCQKQLFANIITVFLSYKYLPIDTRGKELQNKVALYEVLLRLSITCGPCKSSALDEQMICPLSGAALSLVGRDDGLCVKYDSPARTSSVFANHVKKSHDVNSARQ